MLCCNPWFSAGCRLPAERVASKWYGMPITNSPAQSKSAESKSPISSRSSTSLISGRWERAPCLQLKQQISKARTEWRWEASQGGNKHPVWEVAAEGPWVSLLVCIGFVSRNDFLLQEHIGADSGQTADHEILASGFPSWRGQKSLGTRPWRPGSWPGENPVCLFFIQNQMDPDWICVYSNEIQNGTNQEGVVKPQEAKGKSLPTPKSVIYGAAALCHPTQPSIHLPPTTSKCENKC